MNYIDWPWTSRVHTVAQSVKPTCNGPRSCHGRSGPTRRTLLRRCMPAPRQPSKLYGIPAEVPPSMPVAEQGMAGKQENETLVLFTQTARMSLAGRQHLVTRQPDRRGAHDSLSNTLLAQQLCIF